MKASKALTVIALAVVLTIGGSALTTRNAVAATLPDSPHDLEFIDMMMMHHDEGITMARMVETKGQLLQLKEFAARTIADQERDKEELQSLRDRFFANQPKADKMRMSGKAMTMAQMQRMSEMDMRKLEAASGRKFDRTFLDIFTKHHQMALDMSRSEIAAGEQPDVKAMAQKTIDKQTKEVAEMREMKKQVGGGTREHGANHGSSAPHKH